MTQCKDYFGSLADSHGKRYDQKKFFRTAAMAPFGTNFPVKH